MALNGERGPIFDEVPSGLAIMHWFLDKTLAREWVGCGGDADYILSWDPESETGSHLDLIAHVDHDDAWFWLLSVGTQLDGGSTTYDLLFVASNLDGKRSCEWRNEPTAEQPWHYEGLAWFAGQIEERVRTWQAAETDRTEPAMNGDSGQVTCLRRNPAHDGRHQRRPSCKNPIEAAETGRSEPVDGR